MKRCQLKRYNFQIKNKMSKENKTSDKQRNGNDFIADVSGCFSLARYINGYYEYSDNTDDGDIYMNVVTKKFMTETEIVKEWARLNNR